MNVFPEELDNFVPLEKAYKHSFSEVSVSAGFINLYSAAFANDADVRAKNARTKNFILFLFP
jgi:hypothetical protein|tara:strand:+ start:165 stop:350 length:186 start_codon:yes stop_codon:yes gene_type:complete